MTLSFLPKLFRGALTPRFRVPLSSLAAMGTHTVSTGERLAKLRELMKQMNVNVYVVPSEDQHGSEYIASCDERRAFISGFDGSAGCAVITADKALMFTDGRYFLQAGQQLDENWTLMKQGLPDVPTWQEYLTNHLDSSRIGIDARLITFGDSTTLSQALQKKNSSLVSISNLVDSVWVSRPPRTKNPVFHLSEKYSGESHSSKLERLRITLTSEKQKTAITPTPQALVITALDDIAWLFNLRGSDISYNPVFFSYAVVHFSEDKSKAVLFLQRDGVEDDIEDLQATLGEEVEIRGYDDVWEYLQATLGEEVEIQDYDDIWEHLEGLGAKIRDEAKSKDVEPQKVVLIADKASLAIAQAVGEDIVSAIPSPVTSLKAIKNSVELDGFRESHIRDGAALARYFAWLEETLNQSQKEITEWEGAEQLERYRSELPLFKGLSFDTISATSPNGAIIHYSPKPNDCAVIKKDQIYLCDSGAQFLDGTTDVTRTWHFGTPTEEEKRTNTRVLQGHIAIATAIFPNGTTGYIIDSWARRALWKDGLDFRHSTGHGVGHFLNVHEGPHGIGTRISTNATPLKAGMIVTNEPGYYADGKYGIRIENVMLVKEIKTKWNFGEKGYLCFESTTMCPIQTKLVDTTLLSVDEKEWLNNYHKEVWEKVSPLLKNDERALQWLERECKSI